jgi:5-methylcytosine-specific restriction protein A
MRDRICKQCSLPFNGTGSYCRKHSAQFGGGRHAPNPIYRDPRWRKLAAKIVRNWVAIHGWVCPGWRRPEHPSRQLTADHTLALARGGEPFDPANVGVLCRRCNTAKGARRVG